MTDISALRAQGPSVPTERADRAVVAELIKRAATLMRQCEAEFTVDGMWSNDGQLVSWHAVSKLKDAIADASQQAAVSSGEQAGIGAADEPKDPAKSITTHAHVLSYSPTDGTIVFSDPHPARSDSSTGGES